MPEPSSISSRSVLDSRDAKQTRATARNARSPGRYHEHRARTALVDPALVDRLTAQARHALIGGKSVGSRIKLLADEQRTAVRLRLVLGCIAASH